MKTGKKAQVMLLCLGLMSGGLAACNSDNGSPSANASGTCGGAKLSIAQSSTGFNFLPSYLAEAAGYYSEEGLDVEPLDLGGGSEAIAGVVSGSVDIALATHSTIINARNRGARVKSFGALMNQYGAEVVIKREVAEARNITAASTDRERAEALRGLNIGITSPGSGTDQAIRFILQSEGLDPDRDVTLVAVGSGNAIVAAFQNGQVEAIAISSPAAEQAAAQGDGVKLFSLTRGDYEPLAGFLFLAAVTSDSTINERPQILECFSRAIDRALKKIAEDPEGAADLAAPFYKELDPDFYREVLFEVVIDGFTDSFIIDPADAQPVMDFVSRFSKEPVSVSYDDVVDTQLAERALAAK